MTQENNDGRVLRYKDTIGVLCHVATCIILDLHDRGKLKLRITRNFIAKSIKLSQSIFLLWDSTSLQECHILYRCLVDRLFHLRKLLKEDSFQAFENWSFVEQYDFNARAMAEPLFKSQTDQLPPIPESHRVRRRELRNTILTWVRPEAEEMAKAIQREYLYIYGFRDASMHIHPMANDGERDYETVTGLKTDIEWPNQDYVLRNTILVLFFIIHDIAAALEAKVSTDFNNFMEAIINSLETNDEKYWDAYYAIIESGTNGQQWFVVP